ncbi:hypothetical protein EON80_16180 [bacterium]|nr:MAG: hypothetical protein EON80_16180 [bacterium]
MKFMYLKVMALLAGFSLNGTSPVLAAQNSKNHQPMPGEDSVKWENKWYALEDGNDRKLMARRGNSSCGLWVQFRNDYDKPLSCTARVTNVLQEGEKTHHLQQLEAQPGQVETLAYLPGQEISKVEISKFELKA